MSAAADLPRQENVAVGVGWMVLTTLLFVCVTGIVRHIGTDVPAVVGAFIRYLAGSLMMLPFMGAVLRRPPSRRVMLGYGGRGVLHGGGVMLWFYAMANIPIAEVTALNYVTPILITLGAAIFLGERMHLRRVVAVLVGILGALIILRPGMQEISLGQIAQLCATPLFAASFLIAKGMTRGQDPAVIVGMLSIFTTLALAPAAIWQWSDPSWTHIGWLCLTALFATAGHYTMTRALACAPITVTQPVQFLQLVWATILGIVAFGEPLDPFVILGGAIVVASATYISYRERVASRKEITPPASATKW